MEWRHIDSGSTVRVATDSDGRFVAQLPSEGVYAGMVAVPFLGPTLRRLEFGAGTHVFDWSFQGGSLTVRVDGWDRRAPLVVSISGPPLASSTVVAVDAEPTVSKSAVPHGEYLVRAYLEPAFPGAYAFASVTIDAARPKLDVVLDLAPARRALLVTDAGGTPVDSAVVTGGRPAPRAIGSGQYSIDGIAPGVRLRVRPPAGLVPACLVLRDSDDPTIALAPGRQAVIELAPTYRPDVLPAGTIQGLQGSTCPVSMRQFHHRRLQVKQGQPVRFLVDGFPLGDTFVIEMAGRKDTVTLTTESPAVLRLR